MQDKVSCRLKSCFFAVVMFFLAGQLTGCAATAKNHPTPGASSRVETRQDVESAVGAVVGSVSGQDVKRADLEKLGRQIRTDEETRSAVGVLEKSLSGQGGSIKYCPVDGKRYSSRLVTCPEHGVTLKLLDE